MSASIIRYRSDLFLDLSAIQPIESFFPGSFDARRCLSGGGGGQRVSSGLRNTLPVMTSVLQ